MLILICLIQACFNVIAGQDFIKKTDLKTVCYAGSRVNRIYIPPPEEFYRKGEKASIRVSYTGFNLLTRNAFEYAVSILSAILPSNSSFNVKAEFKELSSPGVLAQASATYFMRGSAINAFDPKAYYAAPLAEKIAGTGFNPDDESDMEIAINSQHIWHTGTSGNTPASMYDLVTVVLHELIHGLGFFDSFSVTDSLGSYGFFGIPVIYDKYVQNGEYLRLADTTVFKNPSGKLKNELTGSKVFFNGPVVNALNTGKRIRLHAPGVWDPGSSIAHFDETVTPPADALMSPSIDRGEAIHSPGKLTRALLGELGWINTRFIHSRLRDTEDSIDVINLKTLIVSDTLIKTESAGVIYSFSDFKDRDTLYLHKSEIDDTFRVSLNIPGYNTSFSYSFFVKDCFGRVYRLPSVNDTSTYKIFIGTDTTRPVVRHTPRKHIFSIAPALDFTVHADDNLGIDTLYMEYRVNNNPSSFAGLTLSVDNAYKANINLTGLYLADGDTFEYRVTAVDRARVGNLKTLPDTGFFKVAVEQTLPLASLYETGFEDAEGVFLNDGFSISTPPDFIGPALHTKHPYESPEKDGETLEYTSILKAPIKVDESGISVSFIEIVLVEPGEAGSVFGSEGFYDYVIIEGSTDFGNRWFPLADGYDSRINPAFLNPYNSSMVGMNSTYRGRQSMYQKRVFDLRSSEKFSQGDTMMLRFRLFSDPYANGWGWAIDNLSVKTLTSGIDQLLISSPVIYPNPGNGVLHLETGNYAHPGNITYTVYSLSGTKLKTGILDSAGIKTIDISGLPHGVYFIKLQSAQLNTTVRYVKMH